jgi:hypothetical protein
MKYTSEKTEGAIKMDNPETHTTLNKLKRKGRRW